VACGVVVAARVSSPTDVRSVAFDGTFVNVIAVVRGVVAVLKSKFCVAPTVPIATPRSIRILSGTPPDGVCEMMKSCVELAASVSVHVRSPAANVPDVCPPARWTLTSIGVFVIVPPYVTVGNAVTGTSVQCGSSLIDSAGSCASVR
jgi:hypothetical protein